MAIRTNCIEYGFETPVQQVESGSWYIVSKSIDIPETASRIFADVTIQYHGRNAGTETSANQCLTTMSVQIDSNPSQSFVIPNGVFSSTQEHLSTTIFCSASAYFDTYFTSSRHVLKLGMRNQTQRQLGPTFKSIITYQFDDTNTTTSIKTVRFPIASITGSSLGTTRVYLGNQTGSVDAYDTYLPELSKSFSDIFIEYHANDAAASTTNFALKTKIDANPSASRFTVSQSLASAAYYYDIQTLSGSIDTSTTHSIQVASTVATRFANICGLIYCTYKYDYTGSTQIMNSNIYSMGSSTPFSSIYDNSYFHKTVPIPETGSIILKRTAAMIFHGGSGPTTLQLGISTSSYISYATNLGTVNTGFTPVIFPLDGTGSILPALNITSGINMIRLYYKYFIVASGQHSLYGSLLYLNYLSGRNISPLQNTHTVVSTPISSNSSGAGGVTYFHTTYNASASIDDVNSYISDLTNVYHYNLGAASNAPIYNIVNVVAFRTGSEIDFSFENPVNFGEIAMSNDSRAYHAVFINDATPNIIQYPLFPAYKSENRIQLTASRIYAHRQVSLTTAATNLYSHLQYITYHSLAFPITGSIQNYSGDGSGISVTIYDYTTKTALFTTQSITGGVINTYWFDNVSNLMLVADTGSQRYVSNILPAGSGSYLITIPMAGTSGGEKSFTFIG
jgi:hypothetical protein